MEMPTVNDAARADPRRSALGGGTHARVSRGDRAENDELNAFVYLDAKSALASAKAVDAVIRAGQRRRARPTGGRALRGEGPGGLRGHADDPRIALVRQRPTEVDAIRSTSADCGAPARSPSARQPRPSSARGPIPRVRSSASPATRGTRRARPGGSSGGSSAAVSSGMVPFATASDGGGSIRTPASFTGLVGLKNTYGRIPTFGSTHLAQNSVIGALTTSVRDTALLLDVMAGPDDRDRTSLPPPSQSYVEAIDTTDLTDCRVTWSRDLGFAVVDDRVAALCHDAALDFASSIGAALVDRPIVLEDYIRTYVAIEGVDRFVGVDRDLWENHLDELDPRSRSRAGPRCASGRCRGPPRSKTNRRQLVHDVAEIFEDVDLIVTPMSSMPPFAAEGPMPTEIQGVEVHGGMSVVLAMLANLANLPAISIPAGLVDGCRWVCR